MAAPMVLAATGSEVYIDIRANESADAPIVERWKLYGSSYALVIGIDAYTNGWPRLSNGIRDARQVAAALQQRGFEVTLLTNTKSDELRQALKQFFVIKGRDPEARLFVWFAGHGHTEFGEGYLVPADAPLPEDPEFLLKALHMGDVGSMVRLARAKHVLSIFDSCFAGTVFASQRARPPAAVTKAAVQPVRQFLTSGDADQQVSDDGTFRRIFLAALDGREQADLNGDGYLTGTELSMHMENRVTNLTEAAQTPRSGKLRDARFDRGDFLFLMPQTASLPKQPPKPTVGKSDGANSQDDFEMAFWDSIKGSKSSGDYQAYLEAYPQGRFAPLARARISSLEEAQQNAKQNEPAPAPEPEESNSGGSGQTQGESSGGGAQISLFGMPIITARLPGDEAVEEPPASGSSLQEIQGDWRAKRYGWEARLEIDGDEFVLKLRCDADLKNAFIRGKVSGDGILVGSVTRGTTGLITIEGPVEKLRLQGGGAGCSSTTLKFRRG